MGFVTYTYLGPYLLVNRKKKETTISEKFHPDTGVKYTGPGDFCPYTGKKLEVTTKVLQSEVELYSFKEPLKEDTFYTPPYPQLNGHTLHILNDGGFVLRDGLFINPLTNLDIAKKVQEFEVKYKDYLTYLNDNDWTFSVNYGIVCYAA